MVVESPRTLVDYADSWAPYGPAERDLWVQGLDIYI